MSRLSRLLLVFVVSILCASFVTSAYAEDLIITDDSGNIEVTVPAKIEMAYASDTGTILLSGQHTISSNFDAFVTPTPGVSVLPNMSVRIGDNGGSNERTTVTSTPSTLFVDAGDFDKVNIESLFRTGDSFSVYIGNIDWYVEPISDSFAIYSSDDNSLNFYNRAGIPNVGDTFNGRSVTAIWTGISNMGESHPWTTSYASLVTNVDFVDKIQPDSTYSWFKNMTNLTSVSHTENLDVSRVERMESMFDSCSNLETIDVTNWDISNVWDFDRMFLLCTKLKTIVGLNTWNNSIDVSLDRFIGDCEVLTNVDLSGFNGNATDLTRTFSGAIMLETIDVSNLHTTGCIDFERTFSNCQSITELNIQHFDTSSAVNMSGMFAQTLRLKKIVLGSGFSFVPPNLATPEYSQYLETPNSEYIPGASGLWYAESDWSSYLPTDIPNNKADTYWALSGAATSNQFAVYSADENALRFYSNDDVVEVGSVYDGHVVTELYSDLNNISFTDKYDQPWHAYRETISLVEVVNDNFVVTSARSLFDGMTSLTSVVGAEKLNLLYTTDAYRMFYGCSLLETINTSTWSLLNVDDAGYMFYGCAGLTNIDASNWGMSKATSLKHMFHNASSLISVGDLSSWDVSNVDDYGDMFNGCLKLSTFVARNWNTQAGESFDSVFKDCESLTTADLTGWVMNSSTEFSYMFDNCALLTDVIGEETWGLSSATTLYAMFRDCPVLLSLDVSEWDVSSVTNFGAIFEHCDVLQGLDVSKWDVSSATSFHNTFRYCISVPSIDVSNWNVSNAVDMSYMFSHCETITELDLTTWETTSVTDTSEMFSSCDNLQTIYGLSTFDMSGVTNAHGMFREAISLLELDVASWNMSSATDIGAIFYGCELVSSIDVSTWDVSHVQEMGSVFQDCHNLASIDVSNWDTSMATTMDSMFADCYLLESLDVSKFNTSNVSNFSYMFSGVYKIKTIDVSSWVTDSATDMSYMFNACNKLSTLDVSGWNTSKVTTMHNMFRTTTALSNLDVSKFDVSSVQFMGGMFMESGVQVVDMTNWDTSSVTDAVGMFTDSAVTKVIVGPLVSDVVLATIPNEVII